MPTYTDTLNLYKWQANDQKITTIEEMAKNADKIEEKLAAPSVNYLYVDALKSDSNDGLTPETAVKTLKAAFDILYKMGSKPSFGSWTIKVKGYGDTYTYPGCKVTNMPYFNQRIVIEGDVDSNGEPTTIFKQDQSLGGYYYIGMWIEPGVRNMYVKNITFKNFSNGFNGYGFLMKNQGYVLIENCRAYNCDCGFAGVNNVTISVWRSVATDCGDVGFKALYSSNATFGAGSGGKLFDDGGNGCKALRCNKGVFVSRNAVAHVDYCVIEDSGYAGVHVEMNSRVAVLGSRLKRNAYGVRTEGGAEWINDITEPNEFYEGTADANTINYAHFGNSRESRLYSQDANVEFRTGIVLDQVVHTGVTGNTLIYNFGSGAKLPKNFFTSKGKKIRMRVFGVINGNGDKNIMPYSINADSSGLYQLGGITTQDIFGSFIFEIEIFAVDATTQKAIQRFHIQDNETKITTVTKNMTTDLDRFFRFYASLSDTSASITFEGAELYFMG